jgi:hypothetical protein
MAYVQPSVSILESYGASELLIVADPSTEWGKKAAEKYGGSVPVLSTLQAAHSAATSGRGTVILVGPGTYTLTSALAITKTDLVFKAAYTSRVNPRVIVTSSLADTVQIDASNVVVEGIEFKAGADACTNLIDVADTAAVAGLEIRNCVFNPNGKATVKGINIADATFAMTRSIIEDNTFLLGFDSGDIVVGVLGIGDSIVRNNILQITGAKTGISLADTTAFATGYGYAIYDNYFIGGDATGDEVGITVAGTEDTTAVGIIAKNYFSYCAAAAITIDKVSESQINNYVGDAGTGGTLVDPGTA